jgi:hypothetical protein
VTVTVTVTVTVWPWPSVSNVSALSTRSMDSESTACSRCVMYGIFAWYFVWYYYGGMYVPLQRLLRPSGQLPQMYCVSQCARWTSMLTSRWGLSMWGQQKCVTRYSVSRGFCAGHKTQTQTQTQKQTSDSDTDQ